MADRPRSKIIEDNPIGNGLDGFRASFNSICKGAIISCTPDALEQRGQDNLRNLTLPFFFFRSTKPYGLRLAARADDPDDTLTWDQVYDAVTESTPPPRSIASSLQQTPWLHNTSSFANSSEYHQDMDRILKLELGPLYVGLVHFRETYFGCVAGHEAASEAVFKKRIEGSNPLFGTERWNEWPVDAKENDVLTWFDGIIPKLEAFTEDRNSISKYRRKLLAQPKTPLPGST